MTYRGRNRCENSITAARFRLKASLSDHPEFEQPDPTRSLWTYREAGYTFIVKPRPFLGGYVSDCEALGIRIEIEAGTPPQQVAEALSQAVIDAMADDGPDFCAKAYGL